MALKVKAVEKKLLFEKDGTPIYRYVMSPELYIPLTQAKVIKEAALRSGVSRAHSIPDGTDNHELHGPRSAVLNI